MKGGGGRSKKCTLICNDRLSQTFFFAVFASPSSVESLKIACQGQGYCKVKRWGVGGGVGGREKGERLLSLMGGRGGRMKREKMPRIL